MFSVPEIAAGAKHMLQLGYEGSDVLTKNACFEKLEPYFDECESILIRQDHTVQHVVEQRLVSDMRPVVVVEAARESGRRLVSDMRSAVENASKREFGCILRVLNRLNVALNSCSDCD